MTELIAQLLSRAQSETGYYVETTWVRRDTMAHPLFSAFAALIAEECAKLVDAAEQEADGDEDGRGCAGYPASASRAIREKFKP